MSRPVIDCCVHHHWASQDEIVERMGAGWQEYLNQPRIFRGPEENPIPILPNQSYLRPEGDKVPGSEAPGGQPGSSLELIQGQLLDKYDIERAVLCHDAGMNIPVLPNTHLARDAARAINDWTDDRWLSADERLHALLLVPNQTPADAVEEIQRCGANPKIAGVLMGGNGLSTPFGHPNYHPIYQAAAEWQLPIVIHVGGDALGESITHTAGGGLPTSFGEYHILRPQALMTHLASLIVQGVFEKLPELKVLVVGGGMAWVPSMFWRFDTEYRAYRREAPWVTKLPSEYLRENIRLGTWPLDSAPTPGHFSQLLDAFGDIEDLLIYGSGYPDWDFDAPEAIEAQLPGDWAERVLYRNALDFFRWDSPPGPVAADGAAAVGTME